MKILFTDTFEKSLKRLIRHSTWWYKTYDLFRYGIPRFIKNIWKFRKGLWNYYWFDHHGTLMMMEIGINDIANNTEKNGNEIDVSRLKKVAAMRRVVQIIQNYNNDVYLEMAEVELGSLIHYDWEVEEVLDEPNLTQIVDKETDEEKIHNRKLFNRVHEIEKSEWNELFEILKGQDYSKFDNNIEWSEQFDGTGLRGWWD